MMKNYEPAAYRTVVDYELVFDDGRNNGFGFPCNRDGKLLESEEQNPAAHENYRNCLKHPGRFARFNKVVRYERSVRDNARGTCICGSEVELYGQYLGACQCPGCGRWYNLFGQELLPPDKWQEDSEESHW